MTSKKIFLISGVVLIIIIVGGFVGWKYGAGLKMEGKGSQKGLVFDESRSSAVLADILEQGLIIGSSTKIFIVKPYTITGESTTSSLTALSYSTKTGVAETVRLYKSFLARKGYHISSDEIIDGKQTTMASLGSIRLTVKIFGSATSSEVDLLFRRI